MENHKIFELLDVLFESRRRQRLNLFYYSIISIFLFSCFAYIAMKKIISLESENKDLKVLLGESKSVDSITYKRQIIIALDTLIYIPKPTYVEKELIVNKPVYIETLTNIIIKRPVYIDSLDTIKIKKPFFVEIPDTQIIFFPKYFQKDTASRPKRDWFKWLRPLPKPNG